MADMRLEWFAMTSAILKKRFGIDDEDDDDEESKRGELAKEIVSIQLRDSLVELTTSKLRKRLFEESELTVVETVRRTTVSRATLNRWQAGKGGSLENFLAAALFLKVALPFFDEEFRLAVYEIASSALKRIRTNTLREPPATFERKDFIAVHYFVRHPKSFCAYKANDYSRVAHDVTDVVNNLTEDKYGAAELTRALDDYAEAYLLFRFALDHLEWDILNED